MPLEHSTQLRVLDFSEYPGGRLAKHGPFSGQEFRENILSPALERFDLVEVDFDGVFVAAPSFLDEAFGKIVKALGMSEFKRRIRIKATQDPDIQKLIESIIRTNK
jgi:hypothetical protein